MSSELFNRLKEQFDPEKLAARMESAGNQWADDDAAASIYEETKKSELAKLTLEYIELSSTVSGGKGISQAAAEAKALADPRYESHLQIMIAARKTANRSRVRYDTIKAEIELNRSLQSTLRAELTLNR